MSRTWRSTVAASRTWFAVLASLALLSGCPGGPFTVGGNVSGLAGTGLVLQDNGGDDLPITGNGSFAFSTPVQAGAHYAISIKQQPTQPSQTCVVEHGDSTASAAVADVVVSCTTDAFPVGGTVSGLAGSGLVLQDNLGGDLAVAANGGFTFPAHVASGASYSVTVKAQPGSPRQMCTVTNGSGTVGSGPVTDVSVSCTNAYLLGGTISGLTGGGLVLASPGEPDLTLDGGATTFTFATPLPNGSSYAITVKAQPSGQVCIMANGAGTIGADVTSIAVTCLRRTWKMVACGYTHTLGLTLDGKLGAWGSNGYGELGDGTTTDRSTPVQIGSGFTSVVAGYTHTVALKSDGTVWAWGHNNSGQVGDGTTTDRSTPVQVGSGFILVTAGDFYTLAMKSDGTVWAWGDNSSGQLGDGTTTRRLTPVQVGSGFRSVDAGGLHALALKTNGYSWAWGWNGHGQLGDGTTTQQDAPFPLSYMYASVSAGDDFSMGVQAGRLYAWGGNSYGQLGDGTTTTRLTPVQVGDGFASVAPGYRHTAAVKTDATLWAWGDNTYGQLGDGTTTARLAPVQVGSGFTSAAVGGYYTMAIKADGTLWAWGFNYQGQLGDGTTTDRHTPVPIP